MPSIAHLHINFTNIFYLCRIRAKNTFVTRIKKNTLFEVIAETDLLEKTIDNILKDEIIMLTSDAAKKCGINKEKLRLVHVYKEDENKVIEIMVLPLKLWVKI